MKLVNTLIANTKGDGEKAGEDFWVKSERLFYCALIGYIWYEAPEVNTLIANTKGDGEKAGEDFWVKSDRLFYCALIGYIWYEAPEEEKNFTTLLEMINAIEAREDDPEFQSPVDLMFERLEEKDPEHFAVRQYKKFLLSAGKTRSSILISCGARLAPFDIKELRDLMKTDEMELDTIGDRKTALFVIISDTDDTFNFVVSILYTQLFNLLCDKADDEYGGRLPVHVRCLLDEFANIGQIPKFEKLIATIRSREISASIILQSQSQLKAIYKACGARLAPFDIKELRDLMETDEMELDTIGDRKTALFVIISDTDDTFNFVVSILYTQLFNLLSDKADDEYGGRLPVHVRCLLDEFANIGQIPKFEKLIATIRSREISASIILQSQSQLKAIYKDNAIP